MCKERMCQKCLLLKIRKKKETNKRKAFNITTEFTIELDKCGQFSNQFLYLI